jgi:glyoxylase-like metal-dependent hydrolase (beta-lactamase superfamily II)
MMRDVAGLEAVADGVWLLRTRAPGRLQRTTNVYLLADGGRVIAYDSGSKGASGDIRAAAAAHGGIERVVISHAHADHRGGAAGLGAPVFCHAEEVADVEGDAGHHYFDYSKVGNPLVRALAPGTIRRMDGGPLKVAGTLAEGDRVAGFEVLHLPGHAPGLIGLWRSSDRVAIVSDAVFVWDPFSISGLPGPPRRPPPAVRPLPDQVDASIRRIAALDPAVLWLGHYGPLTGDVGLQLERALAR